MSSPRPTAPASGEIWTVRRILDWTMQHLRQHGSETPRLDAEILLARARACRRIELYTHYESELSVNERATMRDLVQRRAQGEPVAYLVGEKEFFSLLFRVTPDVLIPRPDSETLIVELLAAARAHPAPRILDLCTGSGCLAVTAAKHLPAAQITATDISPAALAIARQNAERHGVRDRIRFLEGDLIAALPAGETFDWIISNPPYVPENEIDQLEPSCSRYEPRLALDGGPAGMVLVSRVIRESVPFLAAGGGILIEIGCEQPEMTRGVFEGAAAYDEVRVIKDLAGRPRVVQARRL